MTETTHTSIEICSACGGVGVIHTYVRTSGHDGEVETKTCYKCGGGGRMRVITTTTVEPFTSPATVRTDARPCAMHTIQGNKKRKDRRF